MNFTITLQSIKVPGFIDELNWDIKPGEAWTVTGKNGSGKSILAGIIAGNIEAQCGTVRYVFQGMEPDTPNDFIQLVSFSNAYEMADYGKMYYQQRFNNPDTEKIPRVSGILSQGNDNGAITKKILKNMEMDKLMDRFLIHLSSGELRKVLIVQALMKKPQLLIFDNPFIGIDLASHEYLDQALSNLADMGFSLVFLVPSGNDIPECTSNVLEIHDNGSVDLLRANEFNQKPDYDGKPGTMTINWDIFPSFPDSGSHEVVSMDNVQISYSGHVVCKDFNWNIKRGEKWALLGPNGSGKSTLLSFVYADNPKSYIDGLSLFGNKRGSGESIWEIKKRIGFTSSEMHLYYRRKVTCTQVVESGLYDSVGLYHRCYGEEKHLAEILLKELHIQHLRDKYFLSVSSGEQRLVLFARAMIKNPELLVLDEPFHGLDSAHKSLCKVMVDQYCRQNNKTLIFVTHNKRDIPKSINLYKELD
jgi:molybdate transport system ATP-binding protein